MKNDATHSRRSLKQLDLENLSLEVALETFLVALLNCVSRNPNLPLIIFHEAVQNQGQYHNTVFL